MKLVLVGSTNGVDQVLVAVSSDSKRHEVIDEIEKTADFRGEIYIVEEIEISEAMASAMNEMRPYIG